MGVESGFLLQEKGFVRGLEAKLVPRKAGDEQNHSPEHSRWVSVRAFCRAAWPFPAREWHWPCSCNLTLLPDPTGLLPAPALVKDGLVTVTEP